MKLQPFRDETLRNPVDFRNRLNEMVRRLNETSLITKAIRVPNVQTGMVVTLANPEFTVGAITIGGVSSTSGGAIPTSAPWVADWQQLPNGSIRLGIGGLAAAPAQYAVNLVLFEAS